MPARPVFYTRLLDTTAITPFVPVVNPLLFNFEGAAAGAYPSYLEGHKAMVADGNATAYSLYSYDNADASANVEILMRSQIYFHDGANDRVGYVLRGSGAASTESGYILLIRPTDIQFYDLNAGAFTSLGTSTANGDKLYPGTWYWVRFRANGTTISAKVWRDGETEPGSWLLSATNATHASGWAGWALRRNYCFCDYFSVDTNGGTAPGPADTPGANQYQEDFSGQTNNVEPTGWTSRWTAFADTAEVLPQTSNVLPPRAFQAGWDYGLKDIRMQGGRARLDIENFDNHRSILYYKDATFTNCAVLMKVRRNEVASIIQNEFRIYIRANADVFEGNEEGYYVDFDAGDIDLVKYSGGTSTDLDAATGLTFANNVFYWVRLEATGTTIRFKAWTGAVGDEPGAWDASVTDSSVTGPGHAGFGCFAANRHWEIHYFEIIDNDP